MRKHLLRSPMRHAWAFVLGAILLTASQTRADTVGISGGGGLSRLGSFSGTLSYDAGKGELTVFLKNTSLTEAGGFITGFAFNVDGAAIATLSSAPSSSYQDLSGGVDAQPLGHFEAGAALGGKWTGGGDPKNGIGVNGFGTFVFQITNADTTKLTADSFLTGGSAKGSSDKGKAKKGKGGSSEDSDEELASSQLFAVRFKGFEGGGSDKVPGQLVLVPLPPAAWSGFVLLGVLGLGGIRHRMRRA